MPLREPRTAADGSGYSAVPAGGVDHGFLQARQAANQTASGRPPSITDLTSTDPLPYVAGTPARQGRLRSPWQNCMTLQALQPRVIIPPPRSRIDDGNIAQRRPIGPDDPGAPGRRIRRNDRHGSLVRLSQETHV